MTSPVGTISGLASGIQWRDMIDQIMTQETTTKLDPLTAQQTKSKTQQAAWKSYSDVVSALRDAAAKLRDGTAFGAFQASATASPTTGRALVSATATAGAIAANYKVEVLDVARAEKLGGGNVADVSAALNLSGDVFVGGRKMTIAAGDSLSAIRDKINALNSGSSPSHVSASILTVSSGVSRLVVTSDITGSSGIELVENDGSSVLSSLGLVSASLEANTLGANARSFGFNTASASLGEALAATMPAAGSFKVNGNRVDVDLSQDSLTAIAGKINAAAGANTAIVSNEIVNGATVSRLIVMGTVTTNPDDGAPAEDVSTKTLQQLGFLKNVRGPGNQLLAPTDASLKIDGIPITRSTNTISDALAGVTLTILGPEIGTAVDLSVTHDTSAAATAVKNYASAYNSVASFVATNTAANGPLAFDSAIRSTMRQFKSALLSDVVGLSNTTYTNAPLVGVALDKTGQLQVDQAKLQAALAASPDEVKALFSTAGTSTLPAIQYMATTTATAAGTYGVSITQAATTPAATSNALVGAYGNAAVADKMTVTDSFTGKTSTISLVDSDTVSTIASKLNVAFGSDGLRVGASVTGGSQLQLTGTQYGAATTFTLSFYLASMAVPSPLGFSAMAYVGGDVAGTINGKPAVGAGQLLTASAPAFGDTNDAQGLSMLYTDSAPTASANVTYVQGLGGMMFGAADPMMQSGDGQIQTAQDALQTRIDLLSKRADDVQTRLDAERTRLTKQFTAMETAISRLQSQGNALTSQLNALQSNNK